MRPRARKERCIVRVVSRSRSKKLAIHSRNDLGTGFFAVTRCQSQGCRQARRSGNSGFRPV